jgi:hypothetical protein
MFLSALWALTPSVGYRRVVTLARRLFVTAWVTVGLLTVARKAVGLAEVCPFAVSARPAPGHTSQRLENANTREAPCAHLGRCQTIARS